MSYTLPADTETRVLAAANALVARGRGINRPALVEESGLSMRTVRRAVTVLIERGVLEEYQHGLLRRQVAAKSGESQEHAAMAAATSLDAVAQALNFEAEAQRAALALRAAAVPVDEDREPMRGRADAGGLVDDRPRHLPPSANEEKARQHDALARGLLEEAEALEARLNGCDMGHGSLHLALSDARHAHETAAKLYRAGSEHAGSAAYRAHAALARGRAHPLGFKRKAAVPC